MIKLLLVLGLAFLLVGGIVVLNVYEDRPVRKICDAERLMKGYTGETHCYDYDEFLKTKRWVIVE